MRARAVALAAVNVARSSWPQGADRNHGHAVGADVAVAISRDHRQRGGMTTFFRVDAVGKDTQRGSCFVDLRLAQFHLERRPAARRACSSMSSRTSLAAMVSAVAVLPHALGPSITTAPADSSRDRSS